MLVKNFLDLLLLFLLLLIDFIFSDSLRSQKSCKDGAQLPCALPPVPPICRQHLTVSWYVRRSQLTIPH